jgi:hypothetical protein
MTEVEFMGSTREISERCALNFHGGRFLVGVFVLVVLGFVPRVWADELDEATEYLIFVAGEVPPDARPENPPPPPIVTPTPCLDCQPKPTQPAPQPGGTVPIPRPPNPTQGSSGNTQSLPPLRR